MTPYNGRVADYAPDLEPEASGSLRLNPKSFKQFRNEYPHLRKPIINGICREGETVNIIAASKVGKSWLSVDLGMSIASGKDWLGQFPTQRGPVLLLDNELHPETLSSRLESVRNARDYSVDDLNENFFIEPFRGRVQDLYRLAVALNELNQHEFSAIILDAFYRFIPNGISESDNQAMMSLYNLLDQIAAKIDCAFFVIHHASKGPQGDKSITDVGSGAGAMSRATDTHLVIRPHEESGYAVLDAAVRSFPPMEPMTMFFKHPVWEMSALEPKVHSSKAGKAQADQRAADVQTVKAKFTDGKPFSWTCIKELFACGESRAKGILQAGIKSGLFEEHKRLKKKHARKSVMTYKVATGTETGTGTESF